VSDDELPLPSPPPDVEAYLRRTGHAFQFAFTDADGYVLTEHNRSGLRVDQRVLGRFMGEAPAPVVIKAMRALAGA
jgi:hypothetical protein